MNQLLSLVPIILILSPLAATGERLEFTPTSIYSRSANGYFQTPDQVKARAYWEQFKIIDRDWASTIPVSTQIGNAASPQSSDIYVPEAYSMDRPVGIYIHINAEDNAALPNFDSVLEEHYCIGASPAGAGNNRHDPERIARALNLAVSLKRRYSVDDSRVYIGGYSGGGLISILCGMLYPDVFKSTISTAHSMDKFYWSKIYTRDEMKVMAARGQRWAHIFGTEDPAFYTLESYAGRWEDLFDTLIHSVDGLGHSNASAADFETCLTWIEEKMPPARRFEFSGGRPDKLIWQTELAHRYHLWRSTQLGSWELAEGFPRMGCGQPMEFDFAPADREFFRIESNPAAEFVTIPEGTFEMGDSLGEGSSNELPVHTVQVSEFQMQNIEITHEQMVEVLNWGYERNKVSVSPYFVGDTFLYDEIRNAQGDPQELISIWGGSVSRIAWRPESSRFEARKGKGRGYPCIAVTWYGAATYCNLRSEMEGLTPCYSLDDWTCDFAANGYRLPTEAEWERAARGGLDGRRFPTADTINHDAANYQALPSYDYDTNSYSESSYHPDWNDFREPLTSPVACFPANAYGLHDMAGNVSEFCNDWYSGSYYSSSTASDPPGPATGSSRVLRGGSWGSSTRNCRVADRDSRPPGSEVERAGFRPVRR